MATVKKRGWKTDWAAEDFHEDTEWVDKDFSEVTAAEVRQAAREWTRKADAAVKFMDGPGTDRRLAAIEWDADYNAERLETQAREMDTFHGLEPPVSIKHLEDQVRAIRPDLDVYWEPEALEGSHGDVIEWSLVADDPGGTAYASITFDTIDGQAAEDILASDPSAAESYGAQPGSWCSNAETHRVMFDVFENMPAGAAYREAVVELSHGGPGADDVEETTGVAIDDIGYGPGGLLDYVENPPEAVAKEVQRLTDGVDLSLVNWQEIYDRQAEESGLSGDEGFEERQQAREKGIHQLEGRIMGAERQHGEYVTGSNGEDHRDIHHTADYQLQELGRAGEDFMASAKGVPSDRVPDPAALDYSLYAAASMNTQRHQTGMEIN